MNNTSLAGLLALGCLWTAGCNQQELEDLREENARLRQELASRAAGAPIRLQEIEEFTVGLAAAEKGFDESAFLRQLRASLQDSVMGDGKFTITSEDDEQQVAKVRGMLIQQYLAEKRVPIRISNLAYKLKNQATDFKVGGSMVPRDGLGVERSGDNLFRVSYQGPLLAQMDRESPERFSIPYEDSEGGRGTIPLTLKDVEMFDASQPPQAARQGDISLNWQLSLEKVQVYRVQGYEGDTGAFMRRMRYPGGGLNQYQTIRDAVFLFGYGPYFTGLVQRIETPRFIDQVDVLPLTEDLFKKLEVGISEDALNESLKSQSARGVSCNFVEFTQDKKIWERPMAVEFPFLSRQISQQKDKVFYTKYDTNGPVLIGDYRIRRK